ncbi:hemerythrin domain-containing protein [Thauera mechernichensis]|uniref:Hemerythrin domain-containing protein n=1 Tax=Thauera mechernichensis TaxID=82788 RepID=A0ABW3WJY6_9RHOO|nr:hemerythrin domain-containing protein [Thauera mechernichensis]MDG3066383.1 hemerythrin domain-containing protein [Thauera mechernichensis]
MDAMRILMDEHQSLAAIIHAIRHMIGEIGAGRLQPDHKLLEAMVHYLDAYPERRHHPKEDEFLFGPLRALTHDADAALDRLEAEHAQAEARIAVLDAAVKGYAQDPTGGLEAFKRAFEDYAAFYRSHMITEEREVLPLIRKHFTAEDWDRANAGFIADDPLSGARAGARAGEEDFAQIFSRLVAAAPAPIGLGAGPYKAD